MKKNSKNSRDTASLMQVGVTRQCFSLPLVLVVVEDWVELLVLLVLVLMVGSWPAFPS